MSVPKALFSSTSFPNIMTVDISKLVAKIGGSILRPTDVGYAENIQRWASNAERKPAIVVLATSAADVAAAVPSPKTVSDASLNTQRMLNWK